MVARVGFRFPNSKLLMYARSTSSARQISPCDICFLKRILFMFKPKFFWCIVHIFTNMVYYNDYCYIRQWCRIIQDMNTPPEKSFSISKNVSPAKKEKGILQRVFLEGVPPERSGGGRRRVPSRHVSGAYDEVSSHHTRGACEVSRFATENMFGFHHIDGAIKKLPFGSFFVLFSNPPNV